MKKLLISLFYLTSCCLFGQNSATPVPSIPPYKKSIEVYVQNNNGKEEYRWIYSDKKLSGNIEFYCEIDGGGGIYRGYGGKGTFIDGFRHGKWMLIDCSTGIEHIINYNKGLIKGYYKVYFHYYKPIKKENGSLSNIKCDSIFYETNFKDGNGLWKDFYHNGNLKEIGEYKFGKKEGEWLYYSEYPGNNYLYLKRYFERGLLIDSVKVKIPQTEILEIMLDH